MRSIEASKFLGVKIGIDDENSVTLKHIIPDIKEENKRKLLEFKSIKEMDEFIKWLKQWKKSYKEFTNG